MIADFLITIFSTGILVCITCLTMQVAKLRANKRNSFVYQQKNKQKFNNYDEHFEDKRIFVKEKSFEYSFEDEIYASIEEEI